MTPLSTPDTLRKTLKLLKRFYSGYTDRYMGYTDVNGYKYNGTVENFGSEVYLEARKLLMERPPIEMVFPGNTFNFYFDISYSELIGTYEQQNMFVATLKDNVLRSNCTYKIVFYDCEKRYILRSESWSDPTVYHDTFIMTRTKPVLQIHTPDGDEDIELMVSNDETYDIVYSFHLNKANYDPDHPDTDLVESWDEENGVLTLRELTFRDVNIPMIWIYSDAFNVLPDIGFVGNTDIHDHTLLTIGTDGHDKSHLYPLIYPDNYPGSFDPEDGLTWYIKALPAEYASFANDSTYGVNETSEVSKIIIMRSSAPWDTPAIAVEISYDNSFVKILLGEGVHWHFHAPEQGDYDYDGATYNNRTYAYIELDDFANNTLEYYACKAAFDITFDATYLNPYEPDLGNVVSGVHMETCSDYSDNGVLKKNGFIHSLGDFDGLPPYYKLLRDRDEHRSHVEMYSIRDNNNDTSVKTMEKQTSAIILDSSIPQRDYQGILDSLNKVLVYNFGAEREWFTVEESISKANALTSLVYIDQNTINDDKIPGTNGPHFIYHGDRYFSCDLIALDPELQYARGMLISNDPITYENNAKTPYKKPLRTIARICDIPTDYSHLIHIAGVAPTIIIDSRYIRQTASLNDLDKDRLWNVSENRWCTSSESLVSSLGVFDHYTNLDTSILLTDQSTYTNKINLNPTIPFSSCTVEVGHGGSGYNAADTFTFYIGGVLVTGIVLTVNAGVVETISLDLDPLYIINMANLSSRISSFKTRTADGAGDGLIVDIVVPPEIWDPLQIRNSSIPYDDLFTLKFDEYGFLWFWKYNTDLGLWLENDQLTGPKIVYNQYDDIDTIKKRSCGDVMLYNSLNVQNVLMTTETSRHKHTAISTISTLVPLDTLMSFAGPDYQSSYYTVDMFPDSMALNTYRINYWNFFDYTENKKLLPAYNQLNRSFHSVRGDALQAYQDTSYNQPVMMYYNPTITDDIEYGETCDTLWKIESREPKTYASVLGSGWIDEDGITTAPIYRYNEFKPSDGYLSIKDMLSQMNHESLIEYITDKYPDSYVLQLEGDSGQLSDNELRMYIMDNFYNDPVYKCNDIYRVHVAGERVIDEHGNPLGEVPSGDYVPLIETYSTDWKFNGTNITSDITFIFKLDEVIDLTGFVLKNDEGVDVSSHSLILMNKHFYYYTSNNTWEIIS